MERKTFLLLIGVIVVGVIAGYLFQGWRMSKFAVPTSSVKQEDVGASKLKKQQSEAGWCCVKAGTACVFLKSPLECLQDQGGLAFNWDQNDCNYFCTNVKP